MVLTVVELSTVKPDVVELSIDVDDEVVLDQIGGNVCGGNEKLVELPSSQITPAALTRRDYHLNIKQWLQQQQKNNIDTKKHNLLLLQKILFNDATSVTRSIQFSIETFLSFALPSSGPQSLSSRWGHSSSEDSRPTHLMSSNEKIGVADPKNDPVVNWIAPTNPSC
jgi:hypothetical protein